MDHLLKRVKNWKKNEDSDKKGQKWPKSGPKNQKCCQIFFWNIFYKNISVFAILCLVQGPML
jgi:hypothetical protein